MTDTADRSGSVLDGTWTLGSIVGRGATSTVYSAKHVSGRLAAMKIMHGECAADDEKRVRFCNEAKLAASVRHPNVIDVWGSATTDDGIPVIAMELLRGRTLAHYVRWSSPSVLRVVQIALQMLDAVQACHDAGVLHRDLKPSNFFIQDDDAVKLLDFGVAREMSKAGTTGRRLAIGTPNYMAPEQARAQTLDERTDVFGAGATLYAVFAGALPHDGDDECALDRAARQSPSPLLMAAPSLPQSIAHAIDHAMAHDPARRWQTIVEFRSALTAVLRELLTEDSGTMPVHVRTDTLPATPSALMIAREHSDTIPPPGRLPELLVN